MPNTIRPGDVIADRYRMVDLLDESEGGMFWRARDRVLARHVAFHVIAGDDPRATLLLEAAKQSATVTDPRILRVLDADRHGELCYVVNEWGSGRSLDILLGDGPMAPRRAAWLVSEVADTIARAHQRGQAHGRLVPENVLLDHNGAVKIIGFGVDAALHGLPAGRMSTDVSDLAGLLYAALVGKWAGVSRSKVPLAPQYAGQPLRPRKVRAGIPKPLDTVCDEVLSPFAATAAGNHARGCETAADIRDVLVDFVGDPGALAAAEAGRAPGHPGPEKSEVDTQETESPQPPGASAEETQLLSRADLAPAGQETVAGAAPFHDAPEAPADSGDWLAPRADRPPPPPAFEQPAERPLYASDPVRRPRPGPPTPGGGVGTGSDEYWPWEAGTGTGAGTGGLPPIREDEPEEVPVPGRSWLRLAAVIAFVALLVTVVAFALNARLGQDTPSSGDSPSAAGDGTPGDSASPTAVAVASVRDFDPQGDPQTENPDQAPNVIDGDPGSTWTTMTYKQDFGPRGLKDGVGLLLDLGSDQPVGEVNLDLVGAPTDVELFVSAQEPTGAPRGEPTAKGTADGQKLTLTLPTDTTGRYVLVWLTSLPEPGGFRGEIGEIAVLS